MESLVYEYNEEKIAEGKRSARNRSTRSTDKDSRDSLEQPEKRSKKPSVQDCPLGSMYPVGERGIQMSSRSEAMMLLVSVLGVWSPPPKRPDTGCCPNRHSLGLRWISPNQFRSVEPQAGELPRGYWHADDVASSPLCTPRLILSTHCP
jgi:hypothetical protein